MKVQTTLSTLGLKLWIVLGDDYKPIQPVSRYLRFLASLERAPSTIKNRAFHLTEYWRFLSHYQVKWNHVNLEDISNFIHWLKQPIPGVESIENVASNRSAATINLMLTTIYDFYDFHKRASNVPGFDGYTQRMLKDPKFKPFLYGITDTSPTNSQILKLKEPKAFPGCLSPSNVKTLVYACSLIRDKFLLSLLYETGLRIGEALGLRHQDMATAGKNEISICPRTGNINEARVKNLNPRTVHVSKDLMKLYSVYLVQEYPEDLSCDYVFVNVKRNIGTPLKVANVYTLFSTLHKRTGIKVNPHLFRHTHATELINAGWDMAHVQQRLGHASIQTTVNTYIHLSDDDMKQAYTQFLEASTQ